MAPADGRLYLLGDRHDMFIAAHYLFFDPGLCRFLERNKRILYETIVWAIMYVEILDYTTVWIKM